MSVAVLDWEEHAFVGLRAIYRRLFQRREVARKAAVQATLASQRGRLLLVAQMLAGQRVSIFETDDQVLCIDDRICLPGVFDVATTHEANAALFTLKTILAALAIRQDVLAPDTAVVELARHVEDELPGLADHIAAIQTALPPEADLWRLVGRPRRGTAPSGERDHTLQEEPPLPPAEVTTDIAGQGRADVEVLPAEHLDDPGAEMPEHVFEKVETLEEYQGTPRKTDTDDALEDHEEALRELDMRQLVRTAERPRSIYRSDVILDGFGLDVDADTAGPGHPYPEWDHRLRRHRMDWCRVLETRSDVGDAAWSRRTVEKHRALIQRLRRQFATLRSDVLRVRRQPLGPEFDIDAVVQAEVHRRTGGATSDLLYTDVRRDLHDVTAFVLLDQSYSTDAWLNNERVLDIITETIFCVGEVLGDTIDTFAIGAFSSNTRRACRFTLLKAFADPWPTARGRLGTVEASGYTRIGPALRHAQELLAPERARRKIVLLVTDGRPCDYDRYEGQYGIEDVKKAIETGRQHGIQAHAFAVDTQAAAYFPAMFTQHSYDIVPNPARLTETMCGLFARLLRQT